ncbi:MAG: APC family permease [Actinomycetota bacterium]|nr:APC family permease [Actinomycetota bacterium]
MGRPMSHGELEHTLLPKIVALPVFASDALSSMSYATQEVLIVLALAGTAALSNVVPISLAVSALLAVVIISYRQIVRAYPGGGGAYVVAFENLGMYPGLVVAGALLIDYVLTVAVSITAGADAIASAFPVVLEHKLGATVALIALVTLANLRGSKESGRFFAVPTYGFVLSMYALIFTGVVRCFGGCPQAESATLDVEAVSLLAPLLLLRAFAAGTTALTGVEAIAEGVPVFRYPQSKNAATTLGILGFLSISMFVGLSWLTDKTNVIYSEHLEEQRTVVAQVAHAVFGGGPMFFVIQVMTALILVLAANTAYTGFPVLASILAKDRFMPSQFKSRGDRLVYSNGIVILAVLAALLVWAFDANLTNLIQLYLVGVFLSFTLAQFGTVVRWKRTQEPGWRRSAAINGFGAVVTGVVLIVVVVTKFSRGAWIVIVAMPFLMAAMRSINRHYTSVAAELAHPARRPLDRRRANQHMVIYVRQLDAATVRAVGVVRSMRPADFEAIATDAALGSGWKRLVPDIPMTILAADGNLRNKVKAHLRARREGLEDNDFLTLVVPELLGSRSLLEIFRRPGITRLKAAMLTLPNVQLLNVPMVRDEIDPTVDETIEPARNHVLVLVSGVHNSTLQAIEYAESLHATDVRAVSFGLDPETTEALGNLWLEARIPHPLEIEASPFRDIGLSLRHYIRQFGADGVNRMVTVVMPEFVVKRRRHQILHGQTALVVKRHVLFERGVAAVSVPYHLEQS